MRIVFGIIIAVVLFIGGAYAIDEITYRTPADLWPMESGHSYTTLPDGNFAEVPTTWRWPDPIPGYWTGSNWIER
jgi:hypothetical protein